MKSKLSSFAKLSLALVSLGVLGGCAKQGEIDETGGITAVRSACPSAAIPAMTGDITLFDPAGSRDLAAMDVTATMTNLRSTCSENGADFVAEATFDVLARRTRTDQARDVVLPYFSVIVRGGNAVIAKRVGQVRLSFAAGQDRATGTARASGYINRDAASLPADIDRKIRQKRKPGDADAALDPLAEPDVRAALQKSSFELLVGFNLTPDQLRYNATR